MIFLKPLFADYCTRCHDIPWLHQRQFLNRSSFYNNSHRSENEGVMEWVVWGLCFLAWHWWECIIWIDVHFLNKHNLWLPLKEEIKFKLILFIKQLYKTSIYLSNGAWSYPFLICLKFQMTQSRFVEGNLGLYKEWSVIRRRFCIWNLVLFACLII